MYIFDTNNANDGSYIDGSSSNYSKSDNSNNEKLSILKGPDFNFPKKYPKTLSRALLQAAETDKTIIFVDDKSEEKSLSYNCKYWHRYRRKVPNQGQLLSCS